MRSNTTKLVARNVAHLGIGQIASTVLGVLLSALIGRALEPSQLGTMYVVFAITAFVAVIIDWGQTTYLVREMARGRVDEPELIGSALLFRAVTTVVSAGIAVAIALAQGYDAHFVFLTLLAVMSGIPYSILTPFSCLFRSRDRMEFDAFSGIVGKATTLIATAIALRMGGGIREVILMQGIGGLSTLLVGLVAARRLKIRAKLPVLNVLRELLRDGAPIAAFSFVIVTQPFIETLILSALAGATVVGWFGAYNTIFGIIMSPALILLAATFPQLSRASLSLPDLRRIIDGMARVLFAAAAFTSSALFFFADNIVTIIYGHGRFEQTASILRVGAVFIPLMFLVLVLASTMTAVGRNKTMAGISVARIALCAISCWLIIGYWQRQFGNGAIALVIIDGIAEIPASIACLMLLPKGAVGPTVALSMLRGYLVSICTVVPLSMLQPLSLLYLIPLFSLLFLLIAMAARLVLPGDILLALDVVRSRMLVPQATKSAPDA